MGRETNKNRREAQAQSAREKAAASRALAQQAERRRRAMVVLSSIVVLAVIGGIIAVVVLNRPSSNKASASDGSVASASVIDAVRTVPAATLKTVAQGDTIAAPSTITGGAPLESKGNPELLYIGAEFCPYCAGERWSMAVALSRFGTLDGVKYTTSAGDDVDPNTATLDFKDATYDSKYLSFTPVENEDRERKQLQPLSDDQNKLWGQYSTNGQRGFPFLDFGNKYVVSGPSFDPKVLAGLTQEQIASRLADPSDAVAKSIDGGANVLTAAICGMTDNQPASVCTSDITALSTKFPAFGASSS